MPRNEKRLNHKIKELKRILNNDRNVRFQAYLESLDPTAATDYSLWKATKKIKRPTVNSPPLRKPDGSWARSDHERVDAFAEHLTNVFKPHPYEGPPEHEKMVMECSREAAAESTMPKKYTTKEVRRVIQKANTKKSPGYDLITNKILKELPNSGVRLMTEIYNAMTKLQFIPPQWKVAQIIMLLKPGKQPEDPKSYRPISLLPIPSKIYESLLLLRILPLVEQHKIIPDHQFGFRRKHATVDQIHRLINEIDKSFESKEYCASVFLDISQAFDRVWHEGLLFKIKSSLPNYICQILESFIQNRRFVVQHGEALSRLCDINAGVPQGSVLGPLLYLIYTSDLPTSDCITTGTFADDTAILASHQDPAEASKSYRMALTIF
ncbi:Probable RNA-directed DNA polymerase from transposon X-element [Eumeta japonica]|uniref:Probable RNA-directed DNA polymerase from transposon X-element n=2 Tax=Eumeta variegata TaxID=151549 RepID=A0A4C1XQY9_EUMVA|nr:Probable RNA-directed DNA polymerase from transposon X-element [Eumeta japonica]